MAVTTLDPITQEILSSAFHHIAEEMAVVGGEDDRLDTQVGQHPKAAPQVVEHAVHLLAGNLVARMCREAGIKHARDARIA